jgi:hypothetical protein
MRHIVLLIATITVIGLAQIGVAQDRSFDFLVGKYDGTWRGGTESGRSVLIIEKVSGTAVEGTMEIEGGRVASGKSAFKGVIKKGDVGHVIEFVKDGRIRYTLTIVGENELKGTSEGRWNVSHELRKKAQ